MQEPKTKLHARVEIKKYPQRRALETATSHELWLHSLQGTVELKGHATSRDKPIRQILQALILHMNLNNNPKPPHSNTN